MRSLQSVRTPLSLYRPPTWRGVYDISDSWHEIFVVYGHLAAVTKRLGFATSVLVLPLRPTALVAKQAAEIDILCGGRLRLGVGIGWNLPILASSQRLTGASA